LNAETLNKTLKKAHAGSTIAVVVLAIHKEIPFKYNTKHCVVV